MTISNSTNGMNRLNGYESKDLLHDNVTYQMIHHAQENGYAVPGVCVYSLEGVMATIRAAETARSPVMIQLFPWAMHFYGAVFVELCKAMARAANVPVAVHLDHCLKESDAELALTMPFDSIMIDGSAYEDETLAIDFCRRITQKAHKLGISVEAELGRIDGGEDGLPTLQLQAMMTQPEEAAKFVEEVGVQFLAPSFGNVHGPYGPKGPQWDLQRLLDIKSAIGTKLPLILHGTTIPDEWFEKALELGFSKININGSPRTLSYNDYLQREAGRVEQTSFIEGSIKEYAEGIMYYMRLFGSAGKA